MNTPVLLTMVISILAKVPREIKIIKSIPKVPREIKIIKSIPKKREIAKGAMNFQERNHLRVTEISVLANALIVKKFPIKVHQTRQKEFVVNVLD